MNGVGYLLLIIYKYLGQLVSAEGRFPTFFRKPAALLHAMAHRRFNQQLCVLPM